MEEPIVRKTHVVFQLSGTLWWYEPQAIRMRIAKTDANLVMLVNGFYDSYEVGLVIREHRSRTPSPAII